MPNEDLTIYSCANGRYQDFVPIYIATALWSNPGCHVEIGLESLEPFQDTKIGDAMRHIFGSKNFSLHEVSWSKPSGGRILPNSVRFITEPLHRSKYVYIGDIDLFTLRSDILSTHLAHMQRTKLPFSNGVRKGTARLTGLHFVERDFQYPLPDLSDLIGAKIGDEMLLYKIVERKLGCDMPEFEFFRPAHGVHLSPNRAPWGRTVNGKASPGWNLSSWRRKWLSFRETDMYKEIAPLVSEGMASVLFHLNLAFDDPARSKEMWEKDPFMLEGDRNSQNRV